MKMSNRIRRSPDARFDVVELADYISYDSLDAAMRFLDATDDTFEFLAANPEIGQLCHFTNPRLAGMRTWRVEGFPNHVIYYRPIPEGVEILRVLHGARNAEAIFGE